MYVCVNEYVFIYMCSYKLYIYKVWFIERVRFGWKQACSLYHSDLHHELELGMSPEPCCTVPRTHSTHCKRERARPHIDIYPNTFVCMHAQSQRFIVIVFIPHTNCDTCIMLFVFTPIPSHAYIYVCEHNTIYIYE
jgi:hypothetical protein